MLYIMYRPFLDLKNIINLSIMHILLFPDTIWF